MNFAASQLHFDCLDSLSEQPPNQMSWREASNYAKHMAQLSARIFGEVVRPTDRKSMKVVRMFAEKPLDKSPEIYEYYPRHVELASLMKRLRFLGLFRSVELCHN